jgi:hypothetical protein
LNASTVTSGASSSANIKTLVKWRDGFYVFAAATTAGGTGTVSIPCVGDATATRIGGESGTVPITNGSFSDNFADKNAVHIYRINGGSTCDPAPANATG